MFCLSIHTDIMTFHTLYGLAQRSVKEGKAMKLTNEKIQIFEKQAAREERKDEKPTFAFVSIMISIVCNVHANVYPRCVTMSLNA